MPDQTIAALLQEDRRFPPPAAFAKAAHVSDPAVYEKGRDLERFWEEHAKSFTWMRHLEMEAPGGGAFHYPSIVQGKDGLLHASYSYFKPNSLEGGKEGKSIKYAVFNEAWVMEGDSRPE